MRVEGVGEGVGAGLSDRQSCAMDRIDRMKRSLKLAFPFTILNSFVLLWI